MKLNTKMPSGIKTFYSEELNQYKSAWIKKDIVAAWNHLERAHIIGQRYPYQHTETHWKMLLLGWQTANFKEVLGQTLRLLFGAPLSFVNKVPTGNVGSTRVSIIKPQEIPKDIKERLIEFDN